MANPDDLIPLPDDDFRRVRSYLAPHVYATWNEGEPDIWPPPRDLVAKEDWDAIITLPTDVVLKTTSYEGAWTGRIHQLATDWLDATPVGAQSPFMSWPSIVALEEFDALVFNAVHGYFHQALGCLRNVLETLAAAASLAVTNDTAKYQAWRNGTDEIPMREARRVLQNSTEGTRVD